MKGLTIEEFNKNQLFKTIIDISYKEFNNLGHIYFDDNLSINDILEFINRILFDFNQIINKKILAVDFVKEFNDLKKASIIGALIQTSNIEINRPEKSFVRYSGNFVYYSVLFYWLYVRVFNDKLNDNIYNRIYQELEDNYTQLTINPINHLVIKPITDLFRNTFVHNNDVKEYVLIIMEKIKAIVDKNLVEEPPFVDEVLDKKLMPKFNLAQRFYLFEKLNILQEFEKIKVKKSKDKDELLAIFFNISIDNARHLLKNSYPHLSHYHEKEVLNYLKNKGIE